MEKTQSLGQLKKRYQSLCEKLAGTGPLLQGSISQRVVKGDKGRKQKQGKTYGPYYQWTFKKDGKTVTVNLTAEQAKTYQQAISNNKKVEEILKEMRIVSRQIFEAETKGVKKRKLPD